MLQFKKKTFQTVLIFPKLSLIFLRFRYRWLWKVVIGFAVESWKSWNESDGATAWINTGRNSFFNIA